MPARITKWQAVGLAVALATSALATRAAAVPSGAAISYLNVRYGYALTVPKGLFVPEPVREREEGALWESPDGKASLLAVAAPNESGLSLQEYRAFVLDRSYRDAVIDYAPMRAGWFVLSGRQGDRMFYERITFACDGRYIYGWQMTYPVAERAIWDRAVEAVHRSYRAGRGEDGRCGRTEGARDAR